MPFAWNPTSPSEYQACQKSPRYCGRTGRYHECSELRRCRLYLVRSQTRADSSYYVQSTDSQVECTCPDSAKGNACKHGFAVRLHEERLADQAKYDQWLCEQYEADKAREDDLCFTYDPSVDPPIDFPIKKGDLQC